MIKKMSDDELIDKIKLDSSSPAFEELVSRYEKVYYNLVHKFHEKHPQSNLEELLSDLYIVLNKAVTTFNNKKHTKFSTWLGVLTRFHCLDSVYKKNNILKSKTTSYPHDELMEISNYHYHSDEWDNRGELIEKVIEVLENLSDKRISKIFKLRYLEGDKKNNWKSISEKMGLSQQFCYLLEAKGRKILQAKLKI